MPGGGIPCCSFCGRKWGCHASANPCAGFRKYWKKLNRPKKLSLPKNPVRYAVCGQDWGVCPQSHGRYEISRHLSREAAEKKQAACEKREGSLDNKDSIFVLPIKYDENCQSCQHRETCEGHIHWHSRWQGRP